MIKIKKYVYPKLPAVYDLRFIRIGGSGLANCMFVVARAWILKNKTNYQFINPTWGKFSIGPYVRGEKDKRHYFGLFSKVGVSGLRKVLILLRYPNNSFETLTDNHDAEIITISGLGNYFEDLLENHQMVKDYFNKTILRKYFLNIESHDFSRVIGVHIRLGDYSNELRTNIGWYVDMILVLQTHLKDTHKFYVFSDGTDDELRPLTSIDNVQKVFFGNALSDILALSRCQLIIGSDSTFSGWGAYLGQVPIIFPKRHFGRVLLNSENEQVIDKSTKISKKLIDFLNNQNKPC